MKSRHFPYLSFCAKQRQHDLLRKFPKDFEYLYDFSSNDYLGLSKAPSLVEACIHAAKTQGVGAKASRLLASSQEGAKALEKDIAKAKHTESALLFATGFQANVSVLNALLDPRVLGAPPLVFTDKLIHASMHMALAQNNIKQHRYNHLDLDHVSWWLARTKHDKRARFIITESVFGMDGDVVDLEKLIQLAKDYDAFLYVDEAHATGLFGEKGYGLTCDYGSEIDITMGTFSKALGTSGAYIGCSKTLKRYLVNRCLGLIYSTAIAPMQIATMHAAWKSVPHYQDKVALLIKRANILRQKLQAIGFNVGTSTTHIIPVIFKDAKKTLDTQASLKKHRILVAAIRPPSVLPTQSRLRITLNVHHGEKAINALLSALAFCAYESDLIS